MRPPHKYSPHIIKGTPTLHEHETSAGHNTGVVPQQSACGSESETEIPPTLRQSGHTMRPPHKYSPDVVKGTPTLHEHEMSAGHNTGAVPRQSAHGSESETEIPPIPRQSGHTMRPPHKYSPNVIKGTPTLHEMSAGHNTGVVPQPMYDTPGSQGRRRQRQVSESCDDSNSHGMKTPRQSGCTMRGPPCRFSPDVIKGTPTSHEMSAGRNTGAASQQSRETNDMSHHSSSGQKRQVMSEEPMCVIPVVHDTP